MKSSQAFLGLLVVVLSLAACNNHTPDVYSAPHSAAQTGVIVMSSGSSSATAQIEKLKNQAGVKVRTLSERHGVFEFYGLSAREIAEIAPAVEVENNEYFARLIPGTNRRPATSKILSLLTDSTSNSASAAASSVPPILSTCNFQKTDKPIANLDVDFALDMQTLTMELGDQAAFAGDASVAHFSNPSDLKHRWLVFAPENSNIKDEIADGSSFKFTPDNVGFYEIILVVEDDEKACGVAAQQLLVTWNPQLRLPKANDAKPSADLSHFKHLQYVDAQDAWTKATGKGVTIAVLDTGLNFNHRAIAWNLAVNEQELTGTLGSDDDQNQFADDELGWDFVNGDANAFDDQGHGSHVAGIAASHIMGAAKDAQILPVKVLNAFGGGDVATVTAGIYYAVDNGADIINMSLGSPGKVFQSLTKAIAYAHSKNVLVVVAAGNGDQQGIGMDLDEPGVDIYPAEIEIPNVLTVAATDEFSALTEYSNYGELEVDVAAPGGSSTEPILSLATQNAQDYTFVPSGGTSMASPLVAGIAALVLEIAPQMKTHELIDTLVSAGTDSPALEKKVRSEKVINANLAVDYAG